MITLHTSSVNIKEIKELLTYKIKHTYLEKYIEQPVIDEGKLMALSMIVNHTSLPIETKKQYVITIMLVQMALDTHDLVQITNDNHENETTIVSRQLTVLAGDYYSGLYYLLLAEIKDVNLIHTLAVTIKEINEYKMKLYYKEVDSFDNYIEIVSKVESLLITRFADSLGHSSVNEIIEKIICTTKLIEEKKEFTDQSQSSILRHWHLHHESGARLPHLREVESMIEQHASEIEKQLYEPAIHLSINKMHLHHMLQELIYDHTTVAEEG